MTVYGEPLGVVVIDDSEEVRDALTLVIAAQSDLTLLGAVGGVTLGIDMVRSLRPDVVVLDVNMPDGGGQRAAQEITAEFPAVRIIAFSAFDKVLIRKVMTAAGADAYVSKWGPTRDLLAAIRAGRDPCAPPLTPVTRSAMPWSDD